MSPEHIKRIDAVQVKVLACHGELQAIRKEEAANPHHAEMSEDAIELLDVQIIALDEVYDQLGNLL